MSGAINDEQYFPVIYDYDMRMRMVLSWKDVPSVGEIMV